MFCLVGALFLCIGCQKDKVDTVKLTEEVAFGIKIPSESGVKSLKESDINDAYRAIVRIQEENAPVNDYKEYDLKIYKLGDDMVTTKIALPVGNYNIILFYIANEINQLIYMCPPENYSVAQNLEDPLPIAFTVEKGKTNLQEVEVLTTSHLTPEDFGLVRFPLDPVGTLQFYISAMEFGADKWVDPDLIIESGSYVISYELDSWYYNEVMIRDDFYSYKFTLTKTGFKTYTQNYSIDFLRKYNTTPLIIEMVRE